MLFVFKGLVYIPFCWKSHYFIISSYILNIHFWEFYGIYSGALVTWRVAKQSILIIETQPRVWIQIGTHATLFYGASYDDDIAQHGGHPANTKSCSLGLQNISLILDIHIMFDWWLSYQEINWKVSHDHIADSSRSHVFLKFTDDQVLVFKWIAGSCQVNLLKTGQDYSEAG